MLSLVIRALSMAAIIDHATTDGTLTVAVNFYNRSKRCATPNAAAGHAIDHSVVNIFH